jgi:hypothetical protein
MPTSFWCKNYYRKTGKIGKIITVVNITEKQVK